MKLYGRNTVKFEKGFVEIGDQNMRIGKLCR